MNTVKSEETPEYLTRVCDDDIIARALEILSARVHRAAVFESPASVKQYLTVRAAGKASEVFTVVYLDSQHRLIESVDHFTGTINQVSIYPREIVRAALRYNAAAVILSHNHPSGIPEPSRADETLTHTLKSALAVVDVRVLDHIVVAGGSAVSMAEKGLV